MTLTVCAIFKDEALYLREWIEFHLIVGVEHFTLYQNNSTDDYLSVLRPYIDSGLVDVIEWPMLPPSQLAAYWDYICKHRGQPQWTAFIDCDEFLWSPKYDTISEALDSLPYSAIGANWMMFGSGGKEEWEDIPVIERFTWRLNTDAQVNTHIKSIIRMDQYVGMGGDPHFFYAERGTFNEKGYHEKCGTDVPDFHS